MSFLRQVSTLRVSVARPLLTGAPRTFAPARFAHQDYGSGQGNPVGEKPQEQGKNPSEGLEHPGPPAPKVGQGKSPSPNEKQQSSSSSASEEGKGGHRTGGSGSNKATKGAQPKILNENPPGEHDEGVKQHNKEMEQRADRAHEQVSNKDAEKDKVSPKFWSGQGGADKDP